MTDERLCVRCGHNRNWNGACGYPVHEMFGHDISHHHFEEAAPPTDEGERGDEFPAGEGDPRGKLDSAWVKVIAAIARGDESIHRYRAEVEAAIRAPLEESRQRLTDAFCEVWLREVGRAEAAEERIRELEAELNGTVATYMETTGDMGAEVLALRVENQRLREALRGMVAGATAVDATTGVEWCSECWSRVGSCDDDCDAAAARLALATPPSSTEGDGTQVPD